MFCFLNQYKSGGDSLIRGEDGTAQSLPMQLTLKLSRFFINQRCRRAWPRERWGRIFVVISEGSFPVVDQGWDLLIHGCCGPGGRDGLIRVWVIVC